MKKVSLYIAATPWNFLNSFIFANHAKNEISYLMYVDFTEGLKNPYLEVLDEMGCDSPFTKTWCFHGKYKGVWQKWRKRLIEIQRIKQIVADIQPEKIYVGSDRRIEFQCAMTEAVRHKPNVKGIYLDEGVFSYTCRKHSQTWRDRVLDARIKKSMYPCDWKHPATIGASDWISEGWLLKPDLACNILQEKIRLYPIPIELYQGKQIARMVEHMLKGETDMLHHDADALLILPHPSLLTEEVKSAINQLIVDCGAQTLLVKPHPRMQKDLNWLECTSRLLPALIPLEVIVPVLRVKQVLSPQSTAVITSALLRDDLLFLFYGDSDRSFQKLLSQIIKVP